MNYFKKLSLKTKWVMIISFIIVIAVAITSFANQITVRNIFNENNHNTTTANSQTAVSQISLILENYETSLLQYAQMMELLFEQPEASQEQINNLAERMKNQTDDYIAAYYMDFVTGKLNISPTFDGEFDVRNSSTYAKLNANPEIQWMDVYLDNTINKLMTSVIAPVFKNGELIGAVGYDLDFSAIGEIRENLEDASSSKLMLIDPNGLIISSFIEDGDGKNLLSASSGQIEGVSDLLEPAELSKQFNWLESNATSANDFIWDNQHYNGQILTIEKNNWKVASFVDSSIHESQLSKLTLIAIISILIGLIIGSIFAYFISRKLLSIVNEFKQAIQKTAEGDFSVQFETKSQDEIKELADHYNSMLQAVRGLIVEVTNNTQMIHDSSTSLEIIAKENEQALNNVSSSIEEIATNTNTQTDKMHEGSSSIHQLANGITEIENNAHVIVKDADFALNDAKESIVKVENLEESYSNLQRAFSAVAGVTGDLDEKTKSISEVTNAIAAITEQTNLLALNASIEAARAGEHGKGFAVVADEVRKLAESSKAATNNIQSIIVSILNDTQKLVKVMEDTNSISVDQQAAVDSVKNATIHLTETLVTMKDSIAKTTENIHAMLLHKDTVLTNITEVTGITAEVSAETQEIASSIEEQTSATSEVTNHASNLKNQVDLLNDVVGKFKI